MPSLTTSREYKETLKRVKKRTRKKLGFWKYYFTTASSPANMQAKALTRSARQVSRKATRSDISLAKNLLYNFGRKRKY